ncbi:hypothetical protein GAYE_SCF64G6734 [Galdieria yellowstonensis]|uniref:DUF202 domain-containing protein n=1 Tax=Galdieria yellowstonensis TaxID=3028027 RepID=A0AAV9IND1_9RHOD|nr:hypothetical protein GAYE_SCF64G6734 [Galdieria yellowstonensis]
MLWKSLLEYIPSKEVFISFVRYKPQPNRGNLARDLLANERTFLSWLRTGMASISVGLAFGRLIGTTLSEVVGTLFVFLGLFIAVYCCIRYYVNVFQIEDDKYTADTVGPWILVSLLVAIAAVSFALIFV